MFNKVFKIDKPEPMVVELEGNKYKVKDLTTERFKEIQNVVGGGETDPVKVVLLILDAKERDLANLDIRTLRTFIQQFPGWLLEASNPTEADGNN